MDAQTLFQTLQNTSDRLALFIKGREFTDFLQEAHEAINLKPAYENAVAKVQTMEVRLKAADERETKLREEFGQKVTDLSAENAALRARLAEAERQVATMADHPDVKKKRARDLRNRLRELNAEYARLNVAKDDEDDEDKSDTNPKDPPPLENVQPEQPDAKNAKDKKKRG